MIDTIFALSSGVPPSAIAVVRVTGPAAAAAATTVAGRLPPRRCASLRTLRDADGLAIDRALVLFFPAPASATGEDVVELHVHGGRAVVRAVLDLLARQPGLRPAEPGEFTRRALANARIDLTQAEGLADLLAAESEAARRAAMVASEGAVSRKVAGWTRRLVGLSARLEAQIDFADEDDVATDATALMQVAADVEDLAVELRIAAAEPPSERLHEGIRVVLAGPPNSGKSSLLNAMAGRDVAITAPVAGTTRDRIEAPVVRKGTTWLLIDVAGLREDAIDPIEQLGIERARTAMDQADIVIWLGDDPPPDRGMLAVHARCDLPERRNAPPDRLAVSAATGQGLVACWDALEHRAVNLLPRPDGVTLNRRQLARIGEAAAQLSPTADPLLLAEHLRSARSALDAVVGTFDVEPVLDDLFGRFCIGK